MNLSKLGCLRKGLFKLPNTILHLLLEFIVLFFSITDLHINVHLLLLELQISLSQHLL
jgi:hypothetical protein